MTKIQSKFLRLIVDAGEAVPASSLPRAKRGETLRFLELSGLIHYGPGGWYPTERGLSRNSEEPLP